MHLPLSSRPRAAAVLVVLALTVTSLVASSAPAPALGTTARAPAKASVSLHWTSCGDGGQCAKLTVPLDYAHPDDGRTTKVALFRIPARDPKQRIGSLLMNPGGPGASGVQFVRDAGSLMPKQLRDRFDLVGFDPRGTGETMPVNCLDNLDPVFALDYSPDTPQERTALDNEIATVAQDCQQRDQKILPYISTQSTARDMDRIRQAIGDKKLTYVGYSYGTYLGALYANFFPTKVRAMVLDGAIDPNLDALQTGLQQAVGFEKALDTFLDSCTNDRKCAFYSDGASAAAFDQLAARVDAQPIPAGGRTLGPGEFDLGVAQALYSGMQGWSDLAEALRAATRGDGKPLLTLSDQYTGRHDDGTYDNTQEAFWAIGCLDGPTIGGPNAYLAAEPTFRQQAPRTGVSLLNFGLICAYWPVPAVKNPAPLTAKGAPPIVVIGTTGDPATPLQWAQGLAGELQSGVLLVARGEQHTSYALAGNRCVDDKVNQYLVDLKPPPNDTHCN